MHSIDVKLIVEHVRMLTKCRCRESVLLMKYIPDSPLL